MLVYKHDRLCEVTQNHRSRRISGVPHISMGLFLSASVNIFIMIVPTNIGGNHCARSCTNRGPLS